MRIRGIFSLLVLAGLTGAASDAFAQAEIQPCLKVGGDWQGCLAACTRLIDSGGYDAPTLAKLYSSRGACHRRLGQMQPAMSDIERAIALDPKYANAYLNRSAIHAQQQRYDASIADATKAIELEPKSPLAYLNRCISSMRVNRAAQGIADCREALRLDPDYAMAQRVLRDVCASGNRDAC